MKWILILDSFKLKERYSTKDGHIYIYIYHDGQNYMYLKRLLIEAAGLFDCLISASYTSRLWSYNCI